MRRTMRVSTFLVAFGLAPVLWLGFHPRPQAQSGYAISAVPVGRSSNPAPLKVVSVSMKGGRDYIAGAELKNISEKVITRYALGWNIVEALPARVGYTPGPTSYGWAVGRAVQTELEPSMIETAPAQGVLPDDFEKMLTDKGAPRRIFILVGVAEVTFADGSRWSASPKDFTKLASSNGANARDGLKVVSFSRLKPEEACEDKLCWLVQGQAICETQNCFGCGKKSPTDCGQNTNCGPSCTE